MLADGKQTPLTKLLLALAVWVVYAVVLHAPINPSFRGRKVAVLSVVGFVLMVGAIVAVQWMPETST
jgi:ABC-type transport system involved in cytochrome c biogenesis permease subunit